MAGKSLKKIAMPVVEPITIGPYRLTNTGLEVQGRPSFSEHQGVGDFIERVEKASAWWAADWIAYGETRADWAETIDHLVDVEKFSEQAGSTATSRRKSPRHAGLTV